MRPCCAIEKLTVAVTARRFQVAPVAHSKDRMPVDAHLPHPASASQRPCEKPFGPGPRCRADGSMEHCACRWVLALDTRRLSLNLYPGLRRCRTQIVDFGVDPFQAAADAIAGCGTIG